MPSIFVGREICLHPRVSSELADMGLIRVGKKSRANVIIQFAKTLPLPPVELGPEQRLITFWIGGKLSSEEISENSLFLSWDDILDHLS